MKTVVKKSMIKCIKLSQWVQKELSERINILGMLCAGKTTIGQRMANKTDVIYIPEPYDFIRKTGKSDPRSIAFNNWFGYGEKKLDSMFGKIFLEERGPIDNVLFSGALYENKEIDRRTFRERIMGWEANFPEWLVVFMITPEEAFRRAKDANRLGKHEQLPFLRILYEQYLRFIDDAQNRVNLKVFDTSGDSETNYGVFSDWFKNERY